MSANVTEKWDESQIAYIQECMYKYVYTFIVVIGVTGNVLSIIVLRRMTNQSSTMIYLICLAFFDTFLLICTFISFSLPLIVTSFYVDSFPYIQPYIYYIALISQSGSIYTTVAFTVERFIAVCYPLARLKMSDHPRKVMLGILLLVAAYNAPRLWEYRTVWMTNDNITKVTYGITELGASDSYRKIYLSYAYIIVMFAIPFVSLSYLNYRLYVTIRERNIKHGQREKDHHLTKFLFVIVAVFGVCQLPALIDNIVWASVSNDVLLRDVSYQIFDGISNAMVNVNSAVNFICYCLVGDRFRSVFKQTVCCRRKRLEEVTSVNRLSARSVCGRGSSKKRNGNGSCRSRPSYRDEPNKNDYELPHLNQLNLYDSTQRASEEVHNDSERALVVPREQEENGCIKYSEKQPEYWGRKSSNYITAKGHIHNYDCEKN